MIELNKIYNMDCLEGMKMIEDDSVDLIVADPPYNLSKSKKLKMIENQFLLKNYPMDSFFLK